MTPMQILQNNFLTLSEKLNKFKEINLNKSSYKKTTIQNESDEYILAFPEEESTNFSTFIKKGVNSDFIKLYKAKTKDDSFSIGFHFTYINTTEPSIKCSIKINQEILFSEDMKIDEFKEKINQLNNSITSNNVLENINHIKETFSIISPNKKKKFKF